MVTDDDYRDHGVAITGYGFVSSRWVSTEWDEPWTDRPIMFSANCRYWDQYPTPGQSYGFPDPTESTNANEPTQPLSEGATRSWADVNEQLDWLGDMAAHPWVRWILVRLGALYQIMYLAGLLPGGRNDPEADEDEGSRRS